MKQPKAEAGRWLAQARSDLAFAEEGGTPAEVFSKAQATQALAYAGEFVSRASALIA